MALLDPDRLFPPDPSVRDLARDLYASVRDLPIISPHGHCDPRWFAENERFPDPAALFVIPDHYVFRMLVSQGVPLTDLGVPCVDGGATERDPRTIWRRFGENFHLFRGTPSALWFEHSLEMILGIDTPLSAETADRLFDAVEAKLASDDFRPRALFDRFGIEVLSTTESALDDLAHHRRIRESGWGGRIVTTYRPDAVIDPEFEGFAGNVAKLGELTGEDTTTWDGYLAAHRARRAFFREHGATASDHGHPTARTEALDSAAVADLFHKALEGTCRADEADAFRGHMLTEMARMSLDDGLVMQIHAGSWRNHSAGVFRAHGRDKGFDIPTRTDWVGGLKPLLDDVGMEAGLTIILFTLDETTYSRELAPRRLSVAPPRPALVVLRQLRRHPPLPRDGDGNLRFLQHGRVQRRHPRVLLDPRAPRCRAAVGLRLPCHARPNRTAAGGRGIRGRPRPHLQARQGGLPPLSHNQREEQT